MSEGTAELPTWLVELYPPDRRIAVEFFRKLVDESMLLEIAEADYKSDFEGHLAALTPIWKGEDWSKLHYWYPLEVLELKRWSEPEKSDWSPGSEGLRGHQIRAFCCAVLFATPDFEPGNTTLINWLDSAFAIGGEAPHTVARFLTWKFPQLGPGDDRPFFALALAAIVRIGLPDLSGEREKELVLWIESEESSAPWLKGLSWSEFITERWEALISRLQRDYEGGAIAELLSNYHGPYNTEESDQ